MTHRRRRLNTFMALAGDLNTVSISEIFSCNFHYLYKILLY